jgi:hypothetical protein
MDCIGSPTQKTLRQRHGRKIRRPLFAQHLVQLCRGQHQHLRHLADASPLFIAVGRRRQCANVDEQSRANLGIAIEFLYEIRHRQLVS